MANRRTLSDALDVTPEQEEFIRGQATKQIGIPTSHSADKRERVIDLQTPQQDHQPTESNTPKLPRRMPRQPATHKRPEAKEILDRVLKPRSVRLRHRTDQALTRASLERKLAEIRPFAVQDIAEEALADWLEMHGYLE